MDRKKFINEMFKKLEENHVFLYHDISKEKFEFHKNEFLNTVYDLDEIHFEAGILKLFALFKDAHTMYEGVKFNYVKENITLIGSDYYIKQNGIFNKIEKINGHNIEEVVSRLKELIPYEVGSWARNKICTLIYSPKALQMIDCGVSNDSIIYGCDNGEEIFATLPTKEEMKMQTNSKPLYEYKKFYDDEVLCIRYRRCSEMKDYSFEKFVEDIDKSCKKKPKTCLVDVRYNIGGNSDIIEPLVNWLKNNNIKTYVLMNGGTFSSGTFSVGRLKKALNATVLGTEAGQPTKCYGNIRRIELDGKSFTYCTRYFDLSSCHDENAPVEFYKDCDLEYFDYDGIIKPDIRIENRVEDLNNCRDTQLEESLRIIKNEMNYSIYMDKE